MVSLTRFSLAASAIIFSLSSLVCPSPSRSWIDEYSGIQFTVNGSFANSNHSWTWGLNLFDPSNSSQKIFSPTCISGVGGDFVVLGLKNVPPASNTSGYTMIKSERMNPSSLLKNGSAYGSYSETILFPPSLAQADWPKDTGFNAMVDGYQFSSSQDGIPIKYTFKNNLEIQSYPMWNYGLLDSSSSNSLESAIRLRYGSYN